MATIPYADVIRSTPLPIDAQDVASRIRLVVAGTRAGKEPDVFGTLSWNGSVYTGLPHVGAPFVYEKAAALDATYRSTRSVNLQDGVDPFLPATDVGIGEPDTATGLTNAGSPSAIRDGNPDTYALNTGSSDIYVSYLSGPGDAVFLGFALRYSATFSATAPNRDTQGLAVATIEHAGVLTGPQIISNASYQLPSAADPIEIYAIFPFDARGMGENHPKGPTSTPFTSRVALSFNTGAFAAAGDLKIYDFHPLRMDISFLGGICDQHVRLPASAPTRVIVRGFVAPDKSHTITGWPGGDYTGAVAKQTYGGGLTVIDFEQQGSPVGARAEAGQIVTAQELSTKNQVDAGTYSVKMGQRQ